MYGFTSAVVVSMQCACADVSWVLYSSTSMVNELLLKYQVCSSAVVLTALHTLSVVHFFSLTALVARYPRERYFWPGLRARRRDVA